jgi:hypothetical protein
MALPPHTAHRTCGNGQRGGVRCIQAPRQPGSSPFDGPATRRTCPDILSWSGRPSSRHSAHSPFGTVCINIQTGPLHVGRPRVCWCAEIAKPSRDNRAPARRSVRWWLPPKSGAATSADLDNRCAGRDDEAASGPSPESAGRSGPRFCSCLLVACEVGLRPEQPEQVIR